MPILGNQGLQVNIGFRPSRDQETRVRKRIR
jgi:hypothetical protein